MSNRHRLVHALLLAALLLPTLLIGCGGNDPAANTQTPEPEVDPRFASAEALCEHINLLVRTIVETGELGGAVDLIDLVYAETPQQERLVAMTRNLEPVLRLAEAAIARFATPDERAAFMDGVRDGIAQQAGLSGFAFDGSFASGRVAEHLDRRATLEFAQPDDTTEQVLLVEMDGRWWISGYTYEYDPDFNRLINHPDLAMIERFLQRIGTEATELRTRVNAGEFATLDQFGQAAMGALVQIATEMPELEEIFNDFGDF